MQLLDSRPSYGEACRQARNAEEALLACLSACAQETKELSSIAWPTRTSAVEWISRLSGQRAGAKDRLALHCLTFYAFRDCVFDLADFYRANWTHAILAGAILVGADLRGAELGGTILEHADLDGAILGGADLAGAKYTRKTVWPKCFDPVAAGAILVVGEHGDPFDCLPPACKTTDDE